MLASAGRPRWTLLALVTDGEEAGLMGAAALVTDREVTSRLRAYINLEVDWIVGHVDPVRDRARQRLAGGAVGAAGAASAWRLVRDRGLHAPAERHRFLDPQARDVPGLNFAAVGDSYAYHTARDTPERLSRETLRTTGENVVAIATALQAADIRTRTSGMPTFFDIGGTVAVSYGTIARLADLGAAR